MPAPFAETRGAGRWPIAFARPSRHRLVLTLFAFLPIALPASGGSFRAAGPLAPPAALAEAAVQPPSRGSCLYVPFFERRPPRRGRAATATPPAQPYRGPRAADRCSRYAAGGWSQDAPAAATSPPPPLSPTASPTSTDGPTPSPSPTPSTTPIVLPSATPSTLPSPTPPASETPPPPSPEASATATATLTPVPSPSPSVTPTMTATEAPTLRPTEEATATSTSSPTATDLPSPTAIATSTSSPTATPTLTALPSATASPSATQTATVTASSTTTVTPSPTPVDTATATATLTPTSTGTPTATSTATQTVAPTATATLTPQPLKEPTLALQPPTATAVAPGPGPGDQPGMAGAGRPLLVAVQAFADDLVGPFALPAERLRGSGATVVRLPVQWRWIQPEPSDPPYYHWGDYGNAISALAAMDLQVMAVLYTKPAWASSDGCGPVDRAPLQVYGDYLTALVERFDGDGLNDAPGSPRIAYWEVENEPDFAPDPSLNGGQGSYGSCYGGGRAAAFAEQLRMAYRAIKASDPSATVVMGGLAFDRFHNRPGFNRQGPFDHDFLRHSLSAGRAAHPADADWPWFDWLGLHAYDSFRADWPGPEPADNGLPAKLRWLRQSQLWQPGLYDLRDWPIALTEVGLSSHPSDAWTTRSEALQAAFPGRILGDAQAQGLAMVSWFLLRDRDPGSCAEPQTWVTWGLLRSLSLAKAAAACPVRPLGEYAASEDGAPKPAWFALAQAAGQLRGWHFDRALGPQVSSALGTRVYRFWHPTSRRYRLVAFADNGVRLGSSQTSPAAGWLQVDAGLLPDWTGRVKVTDHLGRSRGSLSGAGSLAVGPEPLYFEAED